MNKLAIPEELKLENYERRIQRASFDHLELAIDLRPGKDGIGATVKCYIEAIPNHDDIVKLIEEKLDEIEIYKTNYRKKNRLFRNLDSAWNVTLDNPNEWSEYNELIPKMKNIEERIRIVEDPIIKAELIDNYTRFNQLHPKCSKQLAIYETFCNARSVKDTAMKELVDAESELSKLKIQEKKLASLISEDHITADLNKQSIGEMFPNIQIGMILHSFNNTIVEYLKFPEIMKLITRAKPPHNTLWLRYDYRFDPFEHIWRSLAELRDMGIVVEDPLFQRTNFVNTSSNGKIKELKLLLLQGEDPNSADLSGNTALVMAATNKHIDIVELLINSGANINCRDKNMMTPLLFVVNRGYMEIVRQLLDLGADRNVSDKNGRTALYYSILSGNEAIVKMFLKPELCNIKDKLWGFTPLHLSANQGNLKLVQFLIKYGCSIYIKDNKNKTAEEVSYEARYYEVYQYLKNERQNAPGQKAYFDEVFNTQIWIGDQSALNVRFCADADISSVLYFKSSNVLPSHSNWLKDDSHVTFQTFLLDIDDEDRTTESWMLLYELVPQVLTFLIDTIKSRDANILICDNSGDSLSPAVLATLLLVRYQMRIKDSLQMFTEIRPSCRVSLSMKRGLDNLQKLQDDKILERLSEKVRHSNVASIAF